MLTAVLLITEICSSMLLPLAARDDDDDDFDDAEDEKDDVDDGYLCFLRAVLREPWMVKALQHHHEGDRYIVYTPIQLLRYTPHLPITHMHTLIDLPHTQFPLSIPEPAITLGLGLAPGPVGVGFPSEPSSRRRCAGVWGWRSWTPWRASTPPHPHRKATRTDDRHGACSQGCDVLRQPWLWCSRVWRWIIITRPQKREVMVMRMGEIVVE